MPLLLVLLLTLLELSCMSAPMNTTASAPPAHSTDRLGCQHKQQSNHDTTQHCRWLYTCTIDPPGICLLRKMKHMLRFVLLTAQQGRFNHHHHPPVSLLVSSLSPLISSPTQAVSSHIELRRGLCLHVVEDQVTQHL